MAENTTTVTILRVGTDQAVKSVNDLRSNIKALKKALGEAEVGSKEYQETLDLLKVNQNALKDAMHATTGTLDDLVKAAMNANVKFDEQNRLIGAETISYNELVHAMANLQEAWRSTTDEAERAKLGERIKSLNDQLKGLDKSIGNNKRNVGNYEGALENWSKGFSATAGSAASVIAPIKNVTVGLQTLSATPVIGILGLLANILTNVMSSMKGSEESTNRLTKAFAGFGTITDRIGEVLRGIGVAVTWVVEKFAQLTNAIAGTTDEMKVRQELAQREADLAARERENTQKDAEAQLEIAKLREQASDKEQYTAKEREAFLRQAGALEQEISNRTVEILQERYNIQVELNALSASDAEAKKKEADSYAVLLQAQTDLYNKTTANNKQLNALRKEGASEANRAARERRDAVKAQLDAEKDLIQQQIELTAEGTDEILDLRRRRAEKEYEIAVLEAQTKIKDQNQLNKTLVLLQQKFNRDILTLERDHQKALEYQSNLHLLNIANQYEEGTKEYLTAVRDLRLQQLEQIRREEGETEDEYNARRLEAQKTYYDSVRALNARNVEDSTAELRLAIAREYGETEAKYAGLMQLAQNNYENLQRLAGESDVEFAIRQAEAQNQYKDSVQEYLDFIEEEERLSWENRMNIYESGSLEYLNAAVDLKKFELDTLHQLEGESNEQFRARELAAEKAYTEAKGALFNAQIQMAQRLANTTSSVLGSIADMYENDEENAEKNAVKIKALRIAEATINTISGAVGAFMGITKDTGGWGIAAAIAEAAAVTAAGIAQISKIRSTKIGNSSSSPATATVSAPTVETSIPQIRNITGASEEERLNRMADDSRVVLVMSDLEVKQEQRKVQVAESSF